MTDTLLNRSGMFSSENYSDCEAEAGHNPCSQLSSYELILGLRFIVQQGLHAWCKGEDRTKVVHGDILPRCWGELRPLHWFSYLYIHVQMHTDTKNNTALSAAFFPGEVITLWVDCMGLCSRRLFLTTGLTNHSSFRQLVGVSIHRLFSQIQVQFSVNVQNTVTLQTNLSVLYGFFHLYVVSKMVHKYIVHH